MPAQNRVRREKRNELLKSFTAENLTFDGQSSSLVVVEQDSLVAPQLFQRLVFHDQIQNDFLLQAIYPADKNNEIELPGLEDEMRWYPLW